MSDIKQNDTEESKRGYSTSEIAKKTQVSLRQLYYWESIGLLKPAYQSFGQRRFRRYGEQEFERLLEIKAWLDLGFSLEAVRQKVTRDLVP